MRSEHSEHWAATSAHLGREREGRASTKLYHSIKAAVVFVLCCRCELDNIAALVLSR